MDFTLDDIITEIKTYALANGFTSVDTYKLNLNSNSDTMLPKLFIKISDVDMDKFLNGHAEFEYNLDLIVIVSAATEKPAIDILSRTRTLLRALFSQSGVFNNISVKNKIEYRSFQLTDDQNEYSKYGGAYGVLGINIFNTELI